MLTASLPFATPTAASSARIRSTFHKLSFRFRGTLAQQHFSPHSSTTTRSLFLVPSCSSSIRLSRKLWHQAAGLQQLIQPQLAELISRPSRMMAYAGQSMHSVHSTAACRAYVGDSTPAAAEYYCNDFEWEELKQEAEALFAKRHAQLQEPGLHSLSEQSLPSTPGVSSTLALQQQQQVTGTAAGWRYAKGCWEAFHARDNATARFYKERRYLLLEFPCLTVTNPPQHFLEIGCGCGSSLLPVLKANPTCSVTGSDLSPTAVQMFKQAAAKAGIAADRVTGYAADSTLMEVADAAADATQACKPADAVLLIFTLAAVAPEEMPAMLHTAFQALRPGGLLLIRDHGLYDLTHLRLPPEQQLAEKLYRRLDGTTCYFFTIEDLQAKAEAAGFLTRECKYACTSLLNRKKQVHMKRVFVHSVFEKPVIDELAF